MKIDRLNCFNGTYYPETGVQTGTEGEVLPVSTEVAAQIGSTPVKAEVAVEPLTIPDQSGLVDDEFRWL